MRRLVLDDGAGRGPSASASFPPWPVHVLAAVATVVGTVMLLAWLTGAAGRWAMGEAAVTKTNAALALLLAGVGLLFVQHRERRAAARAAAVLGATVLLVGVLTLTQHLFGYDLGIDQLLASEPPGAVATTSPNRMGLPACTSLVLLGSGLLALGLGRPRRAAPYLGLTVCLLNLVPAVGFLYGIGEFYLRARVTAIAWPTVVGLLSLGLGLVLAHPEGGPLALLRRRDRGGALLRRLLGPAVATPLALGLLTVWSVRHGLVAVAGGIGALVLLLALLFSVLLWRSAARLSRSAAQQGRVERLYAVLTQVNEAIVRIRHEGILHQEVCRIVAEEGQFPLVWIGLVKERQVTPVAAGGPAVSYISEIKVEVEGALGGGPTGTCIRERRPMLNDDFVDNLAAAPWREPALRHGFRASAAFPIYVQGSVVGALTLYATTPGAFDAGQVRLLEALCADLSYALGALEQERSRSKAEQALRESEQSLREADRRKDEFLALLAHELRNPLAPILNSVKIIRRAAENPALRERAESIIEKQVRHMVRLVDDLLDVSRISQGKITLKREPVALSTVVDSAVETSLPLIEVGEHALSVSLTAQPVLLLGDPVRLAQVFSNVLNNAAKYSARGTPIALSASLDEEGMICVQVKDRGIGIAPELLPRVFELFVQGDSSLERQRGGLGVGLALCKALVEMHGGRISATSDGPGQGSEFVIRLPVAPAPQPADDGARAVEPSGARAPARFRVLVVDDSADVADSMSALLDLLGHQVRSANDGQSALELMEAFGPDVVLLDIGMPQMSGYEVARRMRQARAGQRAVLIAMTGWGQEEDRRKTTAAGFDHHLIKPVELHQLEQLFQQVAHELSKKGVDAGESDFASP